MGLFGSSAAEVPPEQVPEQVTVDETSMAELQNAAISPITQQETQLYDRTGKMCCWADSGLYAFRLRQLEIMNHAIHELTEELWRDVDHFTAEKVAELQQKAMAYKDIDGKPSDNHGWDLLAEDETFFNKEYRINRFREFRDYFITKSGASKQTMKEDLDRFLILFVRYRDILIRLMSEQCTQQGGGRGGRSRQYGGRRRRPVSRR